MCVLDLSYLARIHSQSNLIFTTIPRGRIIILILRGSEKRSTELISGGTCYHPQPLVSNTLSPHTALLAVLREGCVLLTSTEVGIVCGKIPVCRKDAVG